MKYYDQHIHSSFSNDSKEDLENYYKKAILNGIKYVITCEHYDPNTVDDGTTWSCDYEKLISLQTKLKEKYPQITPLLGCELGYRSEYLDEMIEYKNKYDFDLIQYSCHDDGKIGFFFKEYYKEDPVKSCNYYFDKVYESVCAYNDYDVLSHIDFGFKTAYLVDNNLKLKDFETKVIKILKKIIKENKALEINTKVQESINGIENVKYLLSLYKSLGGEKLTLSSDAHDETRYMSSFDTYIKLIKECGFEYLSYFIKRKESKVKI